MVSTTIEKEICLNYIALNLDIKLFSTNVNIFEQMNTPQRNLKQEKLLQMKNIFLHV